MNSAAASPSRNPFCLFQAAYCPVPLSLLSLLQNLDGAQLLWLCSILGDELFEKMRILDFPAKFGRILDFQIYGRFGLIDCRWEWEEWNEEYYRWGQLDWPTLAEGSSLLCPSCSPHNPTGNWLLARLVCGESLKYVGQCVIFVWCWRSQKWNLHINFG